MAMGFYNGRGKSGSNGCYVIRRHNIQNWVNRYGYLSMPEQEVKERLHQRHKRVLFYCLDTGTRFYTDVNNFKQGESDNRGVAVPIELFDVVYKQAGDE